MENFPSALVLASYDSVCCDNNILYRLVRPLPEGIGVQSTDKLVNVVPFRRKYIFEKKHELEEFAQQILRRPLVLQPVLHFGRGLGHSCALTYQDELWLVMVNQTHPKILSRLQMGLDSARGALQRGQPFEIRFRFGKLIQRIYKEHLFQKEKGEAQNSGNAFHECLRHFRYVEWEHCDLNLRYHGYGANINRSSAIHSLLNLEIKWDFEDIGMHEMEWRQPNGVVYPRPHLSAVYEDEIRDCLPGWTINTISPLDYIGDSVPENNYSYSQAGRLYASFRKKRAPRSVPLQNIDESQQTAYGDDYGGDEEGAVGYDPAVHADFVGTEDNSTEHDFGYYDIDTHAAPSQSRQKYASAGIHQGVPRVHNKNIYQNIQQHLPSNYDDEPSRSESRQQHTNDSNYARPQIPYQTRSEQVLPQSDKYGHIHANVKIISHTQAGNQTQHSNYDTVNPTYSDNHICNETFKKQDSDRFSESTNADSGYGPDGDDYHSRGGSYDYNEQNTHTKLKTLTQNSYSYGNIPHRKDTYEDNGIENPAFSYKYHDTSNNIKEQNSYKNSLSVMTAPPRKKHAPVPPSDIPKVAESFI